MVKAAHHFNVCPFLVVQFRIHQTLSRVNIELVGVAATILQVGGNAHTQFLAEILAVSNIADVVLVSTHCQAALQLFRVLSSFLGNDVDNTHQSVGAVECGVGATNNLNTLNILNADWQNRKIDTACCILVSNAAVNHQQCICVLGVEHHLVVRNVVQTADVHVVHTVGAFLNNHTRNQAQSLLNRGDAVRANLSLGDNSRSQRRFERILSLLRC